MVGSEWNGVKSEGGMDCKMGTDSWGDVDKVLGLVLMVLVPPLYGYLCLLLNSQALRLIVGVQVTEEQLESMSPAARCRADEDGDGAVSFLGLPG